MEEGELDWVDAVQDFYEPLPARPGRRREARCATSRRGVETGEACPECGEPLKERWGRFGKFIACSAYPECKYKNELPGNEQRRRIEPTDEICPTCGKPMVIKHGRFGKFIACSGYPECKTTKPVTLGIACPSRADKGQLVERRSRKGRTFYGCSAYPDCNFVVWQRPVGRAVPRSALRRS